MHVLTSACAPGAARRACDTRSSIGNSLARFGLLHDDIRCSFGVWVQWGLVRVGRTCLPTVPIRFSLHPPADEHLPPQIPSQNARTHSQSGQGHCQQPCTSWRCWEWPVWCAWLSFGEPVGRTLQICVWRIAHGHGHPTASLCKYTCKNSLHIWRTSKPAH